MRSTLSMLLGGLLMVAGIVQTAGAQSAGAPAVWAITYFDVAPASFEKVADLLRAFAGATRNEDGNAEFTVLDEVQKSGRFAIVEAWRDKAAADAHAPAMKALGDKLQPFFVAPFSTRPFVPLSLAKPSADASLGTAMYVLTHVDVFPAAKDDTAALVKQLAEDSHKDAGAQRFDVLMWDGHPNHFHLIEAWTNHQAREAHAFAEHTRAFRTKLTPFEGALYDERLYEVVR